LKEKAAIVNNSGVEEIYSFYPPLAIKLVASILLLFFSVSIIVTGIAILPSNSMEQTDVEENNSGVVMIDAPLNGVKPFYGEPYLNCNDISVSANSAFLCTGGGQVIYSKRADDKLPMASITKIMTALVVIENISDLFATVNVSPSAVGIEGSSVYLKTGDEITVSDLLYALMLSSANDAAVALAVHTAGSVDSFVLEMNEKAATLGMTSTSFIDPHGLGGSGHYTTARDYGILMSYAITIPVFREISGTVRKNILINGVTRSLHNHNRLLYSCDGVISGKTGYTIASGRTLVTAAERNGVTLICVTLNASDDWNDHRRLYGIGFSNSKAIDIIAEELEFDLPVVGSGSGYNTVRVAPVKNARIVLLGECEYRINYSYPIFAYAPIISGERIGYICIMGEKGALCSVPLIAMENIPALNTTGGIIGRINKLWQTIIGKEKDSKSNE